jgi:hypothetical protein
MMLRELLICSWQRLLGGISVALSCSACQLLGGLQVDAVETHAEKPSNVTVYLSVRDSGVPLTDLQAEQFRLTENETPLDAAQVGLRLLDRNLVAEHRVLVLLDLSGPIKDSGALALLATQVAPLVERLRTEHEVSLYGFDGSEELTLLGDFARVGPSNHGAAISKQDLGKLTAFVQRDPSSNLNGAVTQAIKQLGRELSSSRKPVNIGSLLIIARGPDLAGRTPEAMMIDAIDESPYQVYAVTVGSEEDTRLPELLGPSGHTQVKFFENLEVGFADVARRVESDHGRYYFLSYCSPARAGERTLMVTVSTLNGDGNEVKGEATLTFDAGGFASGCDSSSPPIVSRASKRSPAKRATPDPGAARPATEPPASTSSGQGQVVPPPADGTYAQ